MSDAYFSGVGAQTHRMPVGSAIPVEPTRPKKGTVPRTSIPWSRPLSESLLQFFSGIDYPYRQVFSIPFKEPLRSEIRRFLISLDAYLESPNPVIPDKDILYGSTQIDYCDILKRIKRKSFEETWKVDHFEYPSWWNDVPWYPIKDIGDIFNYSYLIFWRQEEPDDYLNGFIPVNIKQERIQEYKECLRSILPLRNAFEKIDEMEVLTVISSSMSMNRGSTKHQPHYMLKNKHLYFAKSIGVASRTILNVSPANTRDSVIVDAAALNTISLIDQQTMEVLRSMDEHIHLRDKDLVSRRLYKLLREFRFFLQRDIKKEGITKPRELLKATLEVLNKEYPDIPIYQNTTFYDDFAIDNKGEIIYPSRGHGLGMANALTTLMQLTIHNMVVDRLANDIADLRADALILNDDFVVGLNDEYHLDEYWDMEEEVLTDLSVIRAPEKSFLSERRFVLAERYMYFDTEYEKESYQRRECLMPLSCTNIAHAKEYFRSVQLYTKSGLASEYLDEVISYWGYEFFPNEYSYPYIVGGWRNERIDSVDLSLLELEELEFSEKIVRGFYAAKISSRKRNKGPLYQPPIYLMMAYPKLPKEYWEILDICHMSQINWKYGRVLSRSQSEFQDYWDEMLEARKSAFKVRRSENYTDLLKAIINRYETVQFYPNRTMIDSYVPGYIIDSRIKDIYLDPNPRLSLIGYYNDISYPFKETFSIAFSNPDQFTKKATSLYSKDIERVLKNEAISALFTGKFDEAIIPKDDNIHVERLYLNPIKVGVIANRIDWGRGYPVIKKDYVNPLIDRKEQVYGRIFSVYDQYLLSACNVNRKTIKQISEWLDAEPSESVESILEFILDNYKSRKQLDFEIIANNDSDSDEDDIVEEYYVIDNDIRKRLIGVSDFLADPSLLYTVLSNHEDYVADNRVLDLAIRECRSYYLAKNASFGFGSQIDVSDIKERVLTVYGPLVSKIAKDSGLFAEVESIFDTPEDDDEASFGQLWEEDL